MVCLCGRVTDTRCVYVFGAQVIQKVKELLPDIEINEFYQCKCGMMCTLSTDVLVGTHTHTHTHSKQIKGRRCCKKIGTKLSQ